MSWSSPEYGGSQWTQEWIWGRQERKILSFSVWFDSSSDLGGREYSRQFQGGAKLQVVVLLMQQK